jgi:hypothetical protein
VDDAGLTTELVIRRARPDELGECAALYVRVLRDTFTWAPPEKHREADFYRAAREEQIWVAAEGGRIIGLAALFAPQNFLHSLYVEERGRGVGKALDGPLQLKCQAANIRAQAFYFREGFRCTERGQDGGVAWLRLVRG